ncbi:MAG: YggT family protein [Thermoleophilaceae bacterium]
MTDYLLLAVGRPEVARYVSTLVTVYSILIIARIIMSYFTRIPYNRILHAVLDFVTSVTDPYLGLFRRFIPPVRLGAIALDITPIIALLVLGIVGGIVVNIINPGPG